MHNPGLRTVSSTFSTSARVVVNKSRDPRTREETLVWATNKYKRRRGWPPSRCDDVGKKICKKKKEKAIRSLYDSLLGSIILPSKSLFSFFFLANIAPGGFSFNKFNETIDIIYANLSLSKRDGDVKISVSQENLRIYFIRVS